MRRAKLFLLFFFLVQVGETWAQGLSPTADSLKHVIAQASEDSLKVNSLNELSKYYLGSDPQMAIVYADQARALAERSGFKNGLAFAYKNLGLGYLNLANYPEALIQYQHALEVFESIQLRSGIANMLSNIGVVYFNVGEDAKSIEYHLRSLKVSEEINDKMRIATSLNNIGGVYSNNPGTVDKALDYYRRAVPIFQEIQYDYGVGTILANIGEIFIRRHQYDSALRYLETSLTADRKSVV